MKPIHNAVTFKPERPGNVFLDAGQILTGTTETPLGQLTIAATAQGVCLVEFSDRTILDKQMASLRRCLGDEVEALPGENQHLAQLRRELEEYFAGQRTRFEVALVYPGTDFQVAEWNLLLQIPYGETRSYAWAANQLGSPLAARAVGTCNGLNRISIIIPCHRLINKNGALGGYGGGLWRKEWLLEHEHSGLLKAAGGS